MVGRSIPDEQRALAGEIVHYATGAAFGALFGVLAPRVRTPAVVAGVAYGLLVWLLNDELLVPALGLSREAHAYPASVHAKALASHLVFGTATDAGFRALALALARAVLHGAAAAESKGPRCPGAGIVPRVRRVTRTCSASRAPRPRCAAAAWASPACIACASPPRSAAAWTASAQWTRET